MLFEGVDGALGSVVAVHVGGHKLVLDVPVFFNDAPVLGACFVVEDLGVKLLAPRHQTAHDGAVL